MKIVELIDRDRAIGYSEQEKQCLNCHTGIASNCIVEQREARQWFAENACDPNWPCAALHLTADMRYC